MRFLADMGISQGTVAWLREQGHEAVYLRELGLQRMVDPDILEKARLEERILLTMDLGFGSLLAANRSQLPSVLIFRLDVETPARVNAHLASVLASDQAQLEAGALLSVREKVVRIRVLPINPE